MRPMRVAATVEVGLSPERGEAAARVAAARGSIEPLSLRTWMRTAADRNGARPYGCFWPFSTVPDTCPEVGCQGQPRHGRHGIKSMLVTQERRAHDRGTLKSLKYMLVFLKLEAC